MPPHRNHHNLNHMTESKTEAVSFSPYAARELISAVINACGITMTLCSLLLYASRQPYSPHCLLYGLQLYFKCLWVPCIGNPFSITIALSSTLSAHRFIMSCHVRALVTSTVPLSAPCVHPAPAACPKRQSKPKTRHAGCQGAKSRTSYQSVRK